MGWGMGGDGVGGGRGQRAYNMGDKIASYLVFLSCTFFFHDVQSFLDHVVEYTDRLCFLDKRMLKQKKKSLRQQHF